ncbi:MAG: glycosyltransferase family 4 protein [Dysgonamonadaceae bacterium]|nr:glycosyltransferase family 4 protein [Dysgonamonadaceae bacterium]
MERVTTLKAIYLAENRGYDVSIVTTEQMGRPLFYSLSERVHTYHLDIGIHERFGKESYVEKIVSRYLKIREYRRKLESLLYEIRPDVTVSTLGLDVGFINRLKDGSIKIGELHFPSNFRSLMARKLSKSFVPNLVAKIRTLELKHKCWKLSRLVVLTQEEKAFWQYNGNVTVIPNPITFRTEITATLAAKKALAVGRLAYEKGFDTLIQAWRQVVEKHPEWELHIFGDGDQKEALTGQIAESGLTGKVFIHRPVQDIQNIYPQFSIFLFPSRYLEALPMVLLEAMSFGLPAVAFDAPCGPKDLICDGGNGYLVPTGDIQLFIERTCLLIESCELRRTMGQAAKATSEDFHIEKIMAQWVQLFQELTYGKP